MHLLDIPKQTRPREKLLAMGSHALTDAELLAVMLGSGLPGQNVLQLAQSLLDQFDGLAGLLHAPASSLASPQRLGWLGTARATDGRVGVVTPGPVAKNAAARRHGQPRNVQHFLQLQLGTRDHEVFAVLFLDGQNRLLRFAEMFKGTINQTSVYPREVVKLALEVGASAVIFSHNHPSGLVRPSSADTTLTRSLQSALGMVDVRVLDHIIVGQGQTWSMAEQSPW
jgi:DNA repair protein RadC